MRRLTTFWIGLLLLGWQGLTWASADIRQFSSELLQLESVQVMQPARVFKYVDPEYGANLRQLLNPSRTKAVLNAYYDALRQGNNTEPDITKQIQPLLTRYEKAFNASPKEYEEEYLDSLAVVAEVMQLSFSPANMSVGAGSEATTEEAAKLKQFIEGMSQLGNTMRALIAKSVHEKVAKGMFSPTGLRRALELAFLIAPPAVNTQSPLTDGNPKDPSQTRPVMGGAAVFSQTCAACHVTGAAGAPRFGDRKTWSTRNTSSLPALVQATLKGKGPMPPMAGGAFSDLEIERAVVYLVNSVGGKFTEPALPAGHPGTVVVRPRSAQQPF